MQYRYIGIEPRTFPDLAIEAVPGEIGWDGDDNPDPRWFEPVDATPNSVSVPTPEPAADPAPEGS